jgi:hypothetical protein
MWMVDSLAGFWSWSRDLLLLMLSDKLFDDIRVSFVIQIWLQDALVSMFNLWEYRSDVAVHKRRLLLQLHLLHTVGSEVIEVRDVLVLARAK